MRDPMGSRGRTWVLAALLTASLSPALGDARAATTAVATSPLAELKKADSDLRRILQKQRPSWSPEAEARNKDLRKVVDGFLDFEELSRRALIRHWDRLTAKERQDFVGTLRELVLRGYVSQTHGSPDYRVNFERETIAESEATVQAKLDTRARGKKVSMTLEYRLVPKNGRWVVYDVVTDEQSMLENYRAEFNKVIRKESFAALLKRMKSKLHKQKA